MSRLVLGCYLSHLGLLKKKRGPLGSGYKDSETDAGPSVEHTMPVIASQTATVTEVYLSP